jgi:hypothetical protein
MPPTRVMWPSEENRGSNAASPHRPRLFSMYPDTCHTTECYKLTQIWYACFPIPPIPFFLWILPEGSC